MGRGRQKAKQTKVARQLKYFSPNTDYDALQRELTHGNGHESAYTGGDDVDEVEDDDSVDDEDEDEDDDYADWAPGRGR